MINDSQCLGLSGKIFGLNSFAPKSCFFNDKMQEWSFNFPEFFGGDYEWIVTWMTCWVLQVLIWPLVTELDVVSFPGEGFDVWNYLPIVSPTWIQIDLV